MQHTTTAACSSTSPATTTPTIGVRRVRPVTTELAAISDIELIELLLAHDDAGWREFVRRFDRLVWRCITKVTVRFGTVVGPEDVREVHANFYGALMANDLHKLRMFKPEKGNKLGTWIGMLAINCAWDYLRSVSRQPVADPIAMAEERECASPDPYECAAQREACTKVERLLSHFSRKDRTFVMLYYVESRSPEEIADEMGISVKTVYSKKHKIRTRLEKLLEQEGLSLAA
jgi:RNA polymerase sigma-70 factor, ECF subfamily